MLILDGIGMYHSENIERQFNKDQLNEYKSLFREYF